MNQRLWIVCFVIVASLAGCTSSDNPKVEQDGALDTSTMGRDDAKVADGSASNDSPKTPDIRVSVSSPKHLLSDVATSAVVELDVTPDAGLDQQLAFQRVKSAVELVDRKTKAPVAGTWTYKDKNYHNELRATFTPTASLATGDYLVQVTQDPGKLEARQAVTMFHVGPMPRVSEVRFFYSKKVKDKPLEFDILYVHLSEKADYSVVSATFEEEVAGVWTKLSTTRQDIGWRLPAPLDVTNRLRVTVGQDVGAISGLKLDGLFTGKSGSGDFVATFVPATYANQTSPRPYVPTVAY
jgi:hypothetical protein